LQDGSFDEATFNRPQVQYIEDCVWGSSVFVLA
jgi:hypothetical protein